ncbi:hypothetical protein QP157_11140 [Sphingomonas sp. LR61]
MPSAIFFDMMLDAMSGMHSTVPVMSRRAYSFLSAGARTRAGGADDRTDVGQDLHHPVVRQRSLPPGDRLELVERPAGVAEATAGQLRHRDAERRHQRCERQRDLVADPARGVLVDGRLAERPERHPLPGRDHREREVLDLAPLHPVQEDRHRHGGHLRVLDVAARVRVDEPVDLGGAQGAAGSLRTDEVDGVERLDGHGDQCSCW